MVATVQLGEKNTAGGTFTDKTSGTIKFRDNDSASTDNANPIVIPASSSVFSYEKWLRGKITVAPSVEITNVEFYMDGANGFGTGVSLWAKAVTSFLTPAKPSSSTGFTNAFTYTSGSPLTLGAGPYSSTAEIADHAVLAMEVASTATQGLTPSETATLEYDEI